MTRPLISVVVPLYNHERYIEAALDSVHHQSVADTEIIVVDDGSTDASAARVLALREKHPQIVFWSQPNQGAHQALNAGIHRATGEFVSILNSDDMYHPMRLEECLKTCRDRPEVAAVATGITFIDADGTEIPNPWYEDARSFYERTQEMSLALINGNFLMTTSNLFARKSVFEATGYFAPLRYTHDLEFFLRLLASNKSVHFLERPLLSYRLHRKNTIQEDAVKVQVERAAVVAFYLHTAWTNRVRDAKEWRSYAEKLASIADRQALGALLFHFLEHLGGFPAGALRNGPSAGDRALHRYLRDAGLQPVAAATIGQDAQSLAAQNEQLRKEVAVREAVISDQTSRIGRLEEGNAWLAAQNESLVASRDAAISEQRAWIATLEEAKQWLTAQHEEQTAWIGKLEEAKQWLAGQNEQLRAELDGIKRSWLWRILNAVRRRPGSR